MKTVHIKESGFTIQVENKSIRTPCLINCDTAKEQSVIAEISRLNITDYSIYDPSIKLPPTYPITGS